MSNIPIKIKTNPNYISEQSDPLNHRFVWSYEISIINESKEIVQLLNRFWRITDLTGKVEEVHGPGVVGLQPLIKPEREFIYTSFCQLDTPQGTMEGYYEMQDLNEKHFTVEIPKFILTTPTPVSTEFRSKLH